MLALALAACAAATAPQPVSTASAAAPATIRLDVLLPDDPAARRMFDLTARDYIGRRPGAEVRAVTAGPDLAADLRRQAAADQSPDLVWVTAGQLEALVRAGLLADLQEVARLDRDLDPNAPAIGCDCQRPPPPFRLDNIAGPALSGARVGGRGLYFVPALIGLGDPPEAAGFAILSATPRFETAWAFARFAATEDGQRLVIEEKLGATVLRVP
jgi:ABC-type glycerol-3-phosphate transport system substrate-binding protein